MRNGRDNDKDIYMIDEAMGVVLLKNVVNDPEIEVGIGTYYHDPFNDPRDFARNNVLYHFPGCGMQLKIGKYCSIACGTKFFNITHKTTFIILI